MISGRVPTTVITLSLFVRTSLFNAEEQRGRVAEDFIWFPPLLRHSICNTLPAIKDTFLSEINNNSEPAIKKMKIGVHLANLILIHN